MRHSAAPGARDHPPQIVAGDAVSTLRSVVEEVAGRGHPVVVNTWVLNYLTAEDRLAYLAELEHIGAKRDLSWIYAEAPSLAPTSMAAATSLVWHEVGLTGGTSHEFEEQIAALGPLRISAAAG